MSKKAPAIVKRDSAINWAKAKNYRPTLGTIIIYDFEDNSVGIKLADGESLVNDLPFLNNVSWHNSAVDGTILTL